MKRRIIKIRPEDLDTVFDIRTKNFRSPYLRYMKRLNKRIDKLQIASLRYNRMYLTSADVSRVEKIEEEKTKLELLKGLLERDEYWYELMDALHTNNEKVLQTYSLTLINKAKFMLENPDGITEEIYYPKRKRRSTWHS